MEAPNDRRLRRRILIAGTLGCLAGTLAGIALVAGLADVAASRPASRAAPPGALDGAHLPPLLTVPGEHVTLRYAIVCEPADPTSGGPCDGSGEVHLRSGHSGSFRVFPLQRDDDSVAGRWFVRVPPEIAASPDGFSYYAVLRDAVSGAALTLPAGGPVAPQRSFPLTDAVEIELGAHSFGSPRRSAARVVSAAWGSGPGEVGLSGGRGVARVGPSSFDVGGDGSVTILDPVNKRAARFGGQGPPEVIPLEIDGVLDDLALGADGGLHVLESTAKPGERPLLKSFAPNGALVAASPIADRTWSQLRIGPNGPLVRQEPSEQWLPAKHGLDRATKARGGRPGRSLEDGSELIVLRSGTTEIRFAQVAGEKVRQAWRITSATPLGEVQLAELVRGRLVLVTKAYTDSHDEFVVLVADRRGLVQRFSLASAQWAETAPLARFRLRGSTLYQLGTEPGGAFVDRFDLEVNR